MTIGKTRCEVCSEEFDIERESFTCSFCRRLERMDDAEIINEAYDKHLESGHAMDALFDVVKKDRPEFQEELIHKAISNMEKTIERLEYLSEVDQ